MYRGITTTRDHRQEHCPRPGLRDRYFRRYTKHRRACRPQLMQLKRTVWGAQYLLYGVTSGYVNDIGPTESARGTLGYHQGKRHPHLCRGQRCCNHRVGSSVDYCDAVAVVVHRIQAGSVRRHSQGEGPDPPGIVATVLSDVVSITTTLLVVSVATYMYLCWP